jgi:hypothetical protein
LDDLLDQGPVRCAAPCWPASPANCRPGACGLGQVYLSDSAGGGSVRLPPAPLVTALPGRGEVADDEDAAADGDSGDVDPVRGRVARAFTVLPEAAQDCRARDMYFGVFGGTANGFA